MMAQETGPQGKKACRRALAGEVSGPFYHQPLRLQFAKGYSYYEPEIQSIFRNRG